MEGGQKSAHEQIIQKKALTMLTYYAMILLSEDRRKVRGIRIMNNAEWMVQNGYKFSECGAVSDSNTAYCPNCGAKMDEEKENTHD